MATYANVLAMRGASSVVLLDGVNYTVEMREVPMKVNRIAAHFKTLDLGDVPHSRAGKNKKVVTLILRDLTKLKEGAALRVPLAELGNTKENVRSALNRAT